MENIADQSSSLISYRYPLFFFQHLLINRIKDNLLFSDWGIVIWPLETKIYAYEKQQCTIEYYLQKTKEYIALQFVQPCSSADDENAPETEKVCRIVHWGEVTHLLQNGLNVGISKHVMISLRYIMNCLSLKLKMGKDCFDGNDLENEQFSRTLFYNCTLILTTKVW